MPIEITRVGYTLLKDASGNTISQHYADQEAYERASKQPVGSYRVIPAPYDIVVTADTQAPANIPPVAKFVAAVNGLQVSFTDQSTDSDGTITARAWSFGDGQTSTLTNPSITYPQDGNYTVTLTVTDDKGAKHTVSQGVTVAARPADGFKYDRSRDLHPADIAAPAFGQTIEYPRTGAKVRRLTDPAQSVVVSYSRYSPSDLSNELVLVCKENSTSSYVIRRSDLSVVRELPTVGIYHEPRWSYVDPGVLFYIQGMRFYKQNVVTGETTVLRDFAPDFPTYPNPINLWMGGEGDSSRDSRYWCFMLLEQTPTGSYPARFILTYDAVENRILSKLEPGDKPNMVDCTPSGSHALVYWGMGQGAGWKDGPHVLPINDLDPAKAVKLCPDQTHSGWALDADGNDLFVFQNNRNDWIEAIRPGVPYLPDGSNCIRIIRHNDMDGDWDMGWHFAKSCTVRGWTLVSTYAPASANWGDNQLFFLPLVPNANPLRVSPTWSKYPAEYGYWNEAPAALSMDAQTIYWHSNGGVTGNRGVFEIDLPSQWWKNVTA